MSADEHLDETVNLRPVVGADDRAVGRALQRLARQELVDCLRQLQPISSQPSEHLTPQQFRELAALARRLAAAAALITVWQDDQHTQPDIQNPSAQTAEHTDELPSLLLSQTQTAEWPSPWPLTT